MTDAPNPPNLSPRRATLARWAAILLPIVFGLRALLLIFQLHSEHHPHPDGPPAWPPSPGEELEFRASNPAIHTWSVNTTRKAFPARILTRNLAAAAEKDAGCLLNPVAMAANGGTLKILSRAGDHDWRVRWSGGATVPRMVSATDPSASGHAADMDRLDAAMLAAADCGIISQLALSESVLHDLVNILAGQPLVRDDASRPEQRLNIRVQGPPPQE